MLKGKRIVVTGAASGIGAAASELFVSQGAVVTKLDRTPIDDDGDNFVVDLADPASIDKVVNELTSGIDALCNVAGVPPTAPRDTVLKVNFLGLRRLTEGLIPKLNDHASIVNVASLAGIGWPDNAAHARRFIDSADFSTVNTLCDELGIEGAGSYFFSKEVLIAWTLQNRWAWRDRGIRMNCVSPGPVETPILKNFIETLGDRAAEDMAVMDRAGTPNDIAPILAFFCSDASRWIRGANLFTYGGMHAHIYSQQHNL
ncbi:MAG: coniferyl-alcohol dehydrogenase [Pseudomonadota bacterium]